MYGRLCDAPRTCYARSALLSAGKNGKKPKKVIEPNGKLAEPEPDAHSTVTLKDRIINGGRASSNPEGFLEDFFYLAAVLPSIENKLILPDDLTISGNRTTVAAHATPNGRR